MGNIRCRDSGLGARILLRIPNPESRAPSTHLSHLFKLLRSNLLFLWLPVAIYSGFIVYLSHQSEPPNPLAFKVPDKLIHFTEFFLLGALLARALIWQRYFRHIQRFWYVIGILFLGLFAAADEWHQSFIPGRQVEILDWVADFFGGIVGMGVGALICFWQIKHLKWKKQEVLGLKTVLPD